MFQKWIGAIVLLSAISFAQSAPSSVPATRLAHIRRGINLSEWFAQVYDPKGYTKEHFESWTTASDIALIKSAGFDHVRLSVNPQPMMDAARHHDGTAEYFGYFVAAAPRILENPERPGNARFLSLVRSGSQAGRGNPASRAFQYHHRGGRQLGQRRTTG